MTFKNFLNTTEKIEDVQAEINRREMCRYFLCFNDSIFLKNKILELTPYTFLICYDDKFVLISEYSICSLTGIIEFEIRDKGFFRFNLNTDGIWDLLHLITALGFSLYEFKSFGKTSQLISTFRDGGDDVTIRFNHDFNFEIKGEFLKIEYNNKIEIRTTEKSLTFFSDKWILNMCWDGIYTDSIIFCERKNNTFFYTNNLTDLKNFLEHRKEENEDVYR